MWNLIEATETTERYTYGRATLDMWRDNDGDWWGNAYGEGVYGHWSVLWIADSKEEVQNELLNYARLHEEPLPYPVRWVDEGRPVIEIENAYYRITRNGEKFCFVNIPYSAVIGEVARIEDIPAEAARISEEILKRAGL